MIRKTFTPAEMRELAKGRGSQFLMDDMRAALLYAADLIEAADRAINAARGTDPRPLGVKTGDEVEAAFDRELPEAAPETRALDLAFFKAGWHAAKHGSGVAQTPAEPYTAWNKVRAEVRALAGGKSQLGVLSAVEDFAQAMVTSHARGVKTIDGDKP